ncbi:hypothetical protein MRX96_022121 [Rhipicephalus microplus]
MTAVNASDVTVHLRMNEALSDLVQRLNAENLYAVRELVIRNRGNFETPELYAQIGRCARLRRLSCVSCAFKPSTLLKLVLEQLRYLQKLELSLVQDFKAVVDSEIGNMRLIALQMCDVIRYHSLRRLYVEVGDDRNFELLLELLVCCPNLTELHVHCVRGIFMECLLKCQQLHEHLGQLETFTFTSEVPDSVPIFDSPNPIFRFPNYAACLRKRLSRQAAPLVELRRTRSPRKEWSIPHSSLAAGRFCLCAAVLVSDEVFRTQTAVVLLPILRDLDVRVVARGNHLYCGSCDTANTALPAQGSSDVPLLSFSITRLTLCDVNYRVLPLYFEHYRAAATLRLSGWCPVGMTHYDSFFRHLGQFMALRCLVLQNKDLPLNHRRLMASVSVMPNLQHLCLLTSLWVSEADVSKCIRDSIAHSAQLKCVHVHYRRHNCWLQQRFTGLHRPQGQVLFQGGPCFACCSTETFIGLVKPLNRDCEASVQTN